MHKIRIAPFELAGEIVTGDGAHGIAFSRDGKTAFVTNTWEDSVSIIDLEAGKAVKKIPVGSMPNGIAVMGGKNQGW